MHHITKIYTQYGKSICIDKPLGRFSGLVECRVSARHVTRSESCIHANSELNSISSPIIATTARRAPRLAPTTPTCLLTENQYALSLSLSSQLVCGFRIFIRLISIQRTRTPINVHCFRAMFKIDAVSRDVFIGDVCIITTKTL